MAKAYDVVRTFEKEIAAFAGARYGIAVESCTAAIFLCLKYCYREDNINWTSIPSRTYPGVAMAIKHAGWDFNWGGPSWEGIYELSNTHIIDSALRFRKDMFNQFEKSSGNRIYKNRGETSDQDMCGNAEYYYCLSFHAKKLLPIGRGGMILTNDEEAVEWFKMARFDGRKEGVPLKKDNATICGWNMYMTPEQAARGLQLFELVKNKNLPDLRVEEQGYPALDTWKCFQEGGK